MTAVLRLRGVGLAVPAGRGPRWLVRGLELDVAVGDRIAVIGPSGAGKTTLLRTLAGLRAADEGAVTLDDTAMDAWDPRARARRIAWLPQRAEPWSDVPAIAIVALGRTPHVGALAHRGAADRTAVADALAQVDATALAERRWSTLSGGERQRIMLARMLASDASVLVLDEPTAALDVGHALRVMQCCDALTRSGRAIVFATHDIDVAQRWSDRVVCVGDGTTVGATADVLVPERIAALFDVRARWGLRMVFEPPT